MYCSKKYPLILETCSLTEAKHKSKSIGIVGLDFLLLLLNGLFFCDIVPELVFVLSCAVLLGTAVASEDRLALERFRFNRPGIGKVFLSITLWLEFAAVV